MLIPMNGTHDTLIRILSWPTVYRDVHLFWHRFLLQVSVFSTISIQFSFLIFRSDSLPRAKKTIAGALRLQGQHRTISTSAFFGGVFVFQLLSRGANTRCLNEIVEVSSVWRVGWCHVGKNWNSSGAYVSSPAGRPSSAAFKQVHVGAMEQMLRGLQPHHCKILRAFDIL